MRNLIIGLILGLTISGTIVSAASTKLVMVPDTLLGYNTVSLLTDIAKDKYNKDYGTAESKFIASDAELKRLQALPTTESYLNKQYIRQRKETLHLQYESEHPKLY